MFRSARTQLVFSAIHQPHRSAQPDYYTRGYLHHFNPSPHSLHPN